METINYRDLKEQNKFRKFNEDFTKIFGNDEKHIYVFKRHKVYESGIESNSYEVIKGVKKKNPNGTTVYAYPSSEQFGVYGYYLMDSSKVQQRIYYRLCCFDNDVAEEFLNTRIQLC